MVQTSDILRNIQIQLMTSSIDDLIQVVKDCQTLEAKIRTVHPSVKVNNSVAQMFTSIDTNDASNLTSMLSQLGISKLDNLTPDHRIEQMSGGNPPGDIVPYSKTPSSSQSNNGNNSNNNPINEMVQSVMKLSCRDNVTKEEQDKYTDMLQSIISIQYRS